MRDTISDSKKNNSKINYELIQTGGGKKIVVYPNISSY